MNLSRCVERAAPYAPAVLLVLAAAAGGLRSAPGWLAFSALLLAWLLLRPAPLRPGGQPAALLFFGWLGAAALFSPDFSAAVPAAARHGLAGLFFFYAASGAEGEDRWLTAVYSLGAAAAAVMLYQLASPGWVTGFIGNNPNYSAAFCAGAFAPALLALSGAEEKKEKFVYGALALLLAAGLAASGSRGAALAAVLAAAAGLIFTRRWRWLAGLIAAVLAAAAALPESSLEGLLKLSDPRAFERPRLWGAALEAAAASPLLGWGPGRFGEAFELFKFPYFDGISYYGHSTLHAHSEIMNLAAEAGFPAALLFLLAAGAALLAGGAKKLPLKLCALAALIQGAGDMVFYSGAVALLFWGSLGFAASGESNEGAGGTAAPAVAALLLVVLLGGTAAGIYGGQKKYLAAARADSSAGASPALAQALPVSAALAAPSNVFYLAEAGRAAALTGDLAAAGGAFERALALEPGYAGARLGLAAVHAGAGEKEAACAALRRLEPAAPPPAKISSYNRALIDFDRDYAGKLEKQVCGKK